MLTLSDLPRRISLTGEGLKAKATERQWDVLAKNAVATYICTEEGEPCKECAPYCGEEMRLPEAESLVPQHHGCRCWYEWDWDPSLRRLSVTSLLTRASEPQDTIMGDTVTKTTTTTNASVVKETPTGDEKDGEEYLKVPISSTGTDRDGDRFSEDGLKDLRDQIRETSRPVFENHGFSGDGGGMMGLGLRYDWKGIIGSQDDADIEKDGDEQTLYSYIRPNPESPEGELFASYVKSGMPVGLSIGFRPLDYSTNEEKEETTYHESDLLETSAVGIQSNQESVAGRGATDSAAVLAKGMADAFPDADLDEDTLARTIVSELVGATTRTPGDDAGMQTEDTTTDMTDDNGDPLTREEFERRMDELEKRLGDDSDGESETDESEEKDGDGDEDLAEHIKDLTEAIRDSDAVDSETSNKGDQSNDPEDGEGSEDGTEDETAADDENATEEGPNDEEPDVDPVDPDEDDEKAVGKEVTM